MAQGARMSTVTWLGIMRAPGQFVLFCRETLVIRDAGAPPIRHVNAPVRWREGPMTTPEATPMLTPALSPLVNGTLVLRLCAGAHEISTLYAAGTPIGPLARLG